MAEDDTRMFQGREYVYAVYRKKASPAPPRSCLFPSRPSARL